MTEDRAARKRSALIPLTRLSSKRPCTIGSGGQGLSSLTLFSPSLVDLELSDRGTRVGGRSKANVAIMAHGASLAFGPTTSGVATPIAVPLPGIGMTSLIVPLQ